MSAKDKQKIFIKTYLKPTLKKWGYQTSGQKWWKDCGDFFIAIHLVNSSYNTRDEVRFHFAIGPVIKRDLSDPAKKKIAWRDMRFSHFDETAHMAEKQRNPFRRNNQNIYILKDDTNLEDFLSEISLDFEKEVLTSLEKLQTLEDWVEFFERSSSLSGAQAAQYFREKMST